MRVDLTDPAERAKAVAQGYIWKAQRAAIAKAMEDVAAGRIPPPAYIPDEFKGLAAEAGVEPAQGGFAEGQGPA